MREDVRWLMIIILNQSKKRLSTIYSLFLVQNAMTMLQYSGVYLELYFQLINDVFFTHNERKKYDILCNIAIDKKVSGFKAME